MELKIDQEFEELIPPLSTEEYESLEKNIVENGFNPAFPIINWDGIVIDGHNRYGICKKHNIEFSTITQEFPSRSAAIIWIIDNQNARRNINEMTRAYLTGRRYSEEKKSLGDNQYTANSLNRVGNSFLPKSTAQKIAEQINVSDRTVKNNEKFALAVEQICAKTGIHKQEILSGSIKGSQKDVVALCDLPEDHQRRVVELVKSKQAKDIGEGKKALEKAEKERTLREIEEKERLAKEQARKEREERERLERERIRKEREEKKRLEKERLEKERLERAH